MAKDKKPAAPKPVILDGEKSLNIFPKGFIRPTMKSKPEQGKKKPQ